MALETPPADAALVARMQGGDRSAFDDLYRRFARSVHSVLLARVAAADAEELTQEVFLAAHRHLADLRDPDSLGPWLHTLARNAATDLHRRRGRRPKEEPLQDRAGRPETTDDELRGRVLRHVQSLPEAYQETLLMRLVDGMTGPEIAGATGLTAASVRVNLHRGMELLRELLRKDGWA